MLEDPWDHNGECKYCDELGYHRADCSWLVGLVEEVTLLRHDNEAHTGAIDALLGQLGRKDEELLKANLKVEELRALPQEMAAKIQMLVNCLDDRGQLEEHLFTFPDGDVWEAKRADECVCRTAFCGHPASAHHEGVCEICRVVCWS